MKSYAYRARDYAFGQAMLALCTTIGLTQAGLADLLGVSRRAVAEWEAGLSYPKAERLKRLIALGVQQQAFAAGREGEEIHTFWQVAHQKVLLDDAWLHDLLAPARPVQLSPPAETPGGPAGLEPAAFWIVQERCRLIALLGTGGIGKSMLASYLGSRLAHEFEAVLWRSVRDAPECSELVADCITFCSQTPPAEFLTSLEQRIDQLLSRLQASRCLLVLDNLETLLQSGDRAGATCRATRATGG